MGAKIAGTAFVEIGYQLFTVKIEGAMDSLSGKDRILCIHSWFPTSSDNFGNDLGTVQQILMISLTWEGLQIFQRSMRAVLVAG